MSPTPFDPGRRAPRRALQLSTEELVSSAPLTAGEPLPLAVEPRLAGVDLIAWAGSNRAWIESRLAEHGGILFRGFDLATVERFEALVAASSSGALPYLERSSPRSQVSGAIYTSTDYPPDQEIFLHNEQSYNQIFPRKIFFFCLRAADSGGATPIADCRRVLERLDPAVVRRFAEQGYLYVRNFGDGLGLSWQAAFQTGDPARVESYCREHEIDLEWRPGGRLRTQQRRPAVARHPVKGDLIWFNHLTFFHVSTLPAAVRAGFLRDLAEEDLPNNTYYGDGAPIEPEVMASLHAAYGAERRRFAWREGDVLLLDNMRVAHGREAFRGARRVVVGMADPLDWRAIER